MFKYYSTQRPIAPGTFPKKEQVIKIENFDTRTFCSEIGREVWGFLEYREALTKKETDAYELVLTGMKIYYCVTTSVSDSGKVISAITSTMEAVCKPESSSESLAHKDIYNDWFDSRKEAEKFVKESRK